MPRKRIGWYLIGIWLVPLLLGTANLLQRFSGALERGEQHLKALDKRFVRTRRFYLQFDRGMFDELGRMKENVEYPSRAAFLRALDDAVYTHIIIFDALSKGATIHAHYGGGNFVPLDMSYIEVATGATNGSFRSQPKRPKHSFRVIDGDKKD
ncbi:MAG: hypothetical protein AAB927_02010 [Patescibacteria group bacterium]